jgi:ribosomal protein S18 acetylase RimI-like enzyme
MDMEIRSVNDGDVEDVVELSLLAWEPVFRSFRHVLGPGIYSQIWPEWRSSQREAIEAVCRDGDETPVYVAEVDGRVVGFIAYKLHTGDRVGEVRLLAVHPEYQDGGIGTALNDFALEKMRESGMRMAKVETGGDPSHAPARRCYEKAGYTPLPLVRYFQDLRDE